MKLPAPLLGGIVVLLAASSTVAKPTPTPAPGKQPPRDDVVRLQIYLDEQNFSPGKIDGRYGGFTAKSWQRFQEAQGISPVSDKFDAKTFTAVDPTYTTYTVVAEDLGAIGEVPKELALQAKNKVLPYTSMAELLGERYHVSVTFLRELNTCKNLDALKEGETVKVPNVVPPFNLAQVIALQRYTSDRKKVLKEREEAAKKAPADPAAASPSPTAIPPEEMPGPTVALSASPPPASAVPTVAPASSAPDASPASVDSADNKPALRATPADSKGLVFHVNTTAKYLEVRAENDRLVACFPITPGSSSIPTPKGDWKVVAKTLLPEFRWDKSVLMTGKRSDKFYQLPPGPNNPVGVTWIALSKPGIGMHGTAEPDTIGRSASHGCIRLSNWDAFKVFGMVAPGTKVVIE